VNFALRAGTVAMPGCSTSPGYLTVKDGLVADVGPGDPPAAGGDTGPVVDVGEGSVVAGFFDVHVHGGDGAQVNGDSIDEVVASVERIARFHARHGTTSMLATTVSDSPERLLTTVAGVAEVMRAGVAGGATVRGIHLEGPWIARAKMGAQDPWALRPPDVDELAGLVAAAEGGIRMVTVAPELPGSRRLITAACRAGIVVAIGHTDADFATTVGAIEAGARHATHLFNAMAPPHHRRPGAVTALLLDERVTFELIADLEHVHPAVMALTARSNPGRLVVVTDAVPAAGLEPGTYQLGHLEVSVEASRVTLAGDPATLAGSLLTMEQAVRNLVIGAGMPLLDALEAAASTPALAAGIDDIGELSPGRPADFVVLDLDLGVMATVVAGRPVFDPAGLLADVAG